jgi:hypothetical protein
MNLRRGERVVQDCSEKTNLVRVLLMTPTDGARWVISGVLAVGGVSTVVYNFILAAQRPSPVGKRPTTLVPVVAPLLALGAALIAPSWLPLLGVPVVVIADPATVRLLRSSMGRGRGAP